MFDPPHSRLDNSRVETFLSRFQMRLITRSVCLKSPAPSSSEEEQSGESSGEDVEVEDEVVLLESSSSASSSESEASPVSHQQLLETLQFAFYPRVPPF